MRHLWQIGQMKHAILVVAALRILLLAGEGLFINRLTIAASVALLLKLICPPCRADFVWQNGTSSVAVPYNGTYDYFTPLGPQKPIPPEVNQSFSDPSIGSTITGQVIAGTAATPDGWYVAQGFSNTYSVSGTPANESGYGPQSVIEKISASAQSYTTVTYQSTTAAVSLKGSGYLAPGDTIEYELQGLFYNYKEAGNTLELDISGTITASGGYAIDGAKSSEYNSPLPAGAGVEMAFNFYYIVYKGSGGGTTTFTADPGITLSGPEPATATPEPASLTLLGIGSTALLGYAWRSYRRGKRQADRLEPVM